MPPERGHSCPPVCFGVGFGIGQRARADKNVRAPAARGLLWMGAPGENSLSNQPPGGQNSLTRHHAVMNALNQAVNPKGCQRVAGGRRGGSGGGDLRVTAWKMSCTPAAVSEWQHVGIRSGTPPGCAKPRHAFRWSFSPLPRTTTGYHLPTLRVGFRFSPPKEERETAPRPMST